MENTNMSQGKKVSHRGYPTDDTIYTEFQDMQN